MSGSAAGRLVLGVDGGGSKTEAVLGRVSPDGSDVEILATSVAGPSNLQREPFESSLAQVEQACAVLLRDLPAARGEVHAACFAMAGSRHPALCERFSQWVETRGWAKKSQVVHDARPLITAGTEGDSGIAVIAGTGSFAYGRAADGRESFCGGWGRLVGDEGSAYWLAIEGVRRALQSADGRAAKTCLIDELGTWFGDQSPQRWPKRIGQMNADEIAAAARVVTTAADAGDAVAVELVAACGAELARIVVAVHRQGFDGAPVQLAVAGGLLCGSESVYRALLGQLERQGITVTGARQVPHPSHGAAMLAAR